MAAATFVHRTSRDGDPQLHTHCVVANLGRRPDGTYAALDATPFYEWGEPLAPCTTRSSAAA
jgi:conjugative relaxase-like TrwC/TraI family protein